MRREKVETGPSWQGKRGGWFKYQQIPAGDKKAVFPQKNFSLRLPGTDSKRVGKRVSVFLLRLERLQRVLPEFLTTNPEKLFEKTHQKNASGRGSDAFCQ